MVEKNQYSTEMDHLYDELSDFIKSDTLLNYDDDLHSIHLTLKNIDDYLGLFKKDGISYYSLVTRLVLDCYKLLELITSSIKNQNISVPSSSPTYDADVKKYFKNTRDLIDSEIKRQLVSKSLQLSATYTYSLLHDESVGKMVSRKKGRKNIQVGVSRAKNILLPLIIAKHLTYNNKYTNDIDFAFTSIFTGMIMVRNLSNGSNGSYMDGLYQWFKGNPSEIKVNRDILDNQHKLERLIYAIYEEFFNEIKKPTYSVTESPEQVHLLRNDFKYAKFNKCETFQKYQDEHLFSNPERNEIFLKIKNVIKQLLS